MDAAEIASAFTATSGMTPGLGRTDTMRCFRLFGLDRSASATFPPVTEHKPSEFFGISRDVPLNYDTREHVDGLLIDSLAYRLCLTTF
jgi:hypothetical protein